jgi:cytochrome c5
VPWLARALGAVRRHAFLVVLAAAIAGGVALGISQAPQRDQQGFEPPPTTATTEEPFQSNQDRVRGRPVREVFGHTCGTCHTLRAADVTGAVGPDLDRRPLTARRVREMIRTGSLDGGMPANLLVGKDAERVARYVARVSRASRAARRD